MRSKFKFILFLFILLLLSVNFSATLRGMVLQASSRTIFVLQDGFLAAKSTVQQYFATTATIASLREENEKLRKFRVLYEALRADYDELLQTPAPKIVGVKQSLVRISSYERLGAKTRFWASAPQEVNRPLGLVANGDAVGVLTSKEGRAYAISLQDASCAIAAKIGAQPAIVRSDGEQIWADFVEDYALIVPGAAVITSGMDGIFPAGVFIGRVEQIEQSAGYLRARLKDTKSLSPYRFVYALEAVD